LKAIELFPHVNDLRDRFFPAYRELTADLLEQKPQGVPNSIGFHLRHIAQAEDWFVQGIILGQEAAPKRKAELATIADILAYLEGTREHTLNVLREMEVSKLATPFTMPEGYRGAKIDNPTFSWLFHRMFDHEVYHLAQVNMTLRLLGKEPPAM
jgi:uncharacterized damage-inducible protein DinB